MVAIGLLMILMRVGQLKMMFVLYATSLYKQKCRKAVVWLFLYFPHCAAIFTVKRKVGGFEVHALNVKSQILSIY